MKIFQSRIKWVILLKVYFIPAFFAKENIVVPFLVVDTGVIYRFARGLFECSNRIGIVPLASFGITVVISIV